jgi:hypothetical protein
VTLIIEIVRDMMPFLCVVGITVMDLGFCLQLLARDTPSADAFGSISLSMYGSLMVFLFGAFDESQYMDSSPSREPTPWLVSVFVWGLGFVNLVLLNALIAIMGDTYDRVSETAMHQRLLNRANFILECEDRLPTRMLRSKRLFPKWLHVVQRAETAATSPTRGAWTGRVAAIRDELELRSGRVEQKLEQANARIKSLDDHIATLVGQVGKLLSESGHDGNDSGQCSQSVHDDNDSSRWSLAR